MQYRIRFGPLLQAEHKDVESGEHSVYNTEVATQPAMKLPPQCQINSGGYLDIPMLHDLTGNTIITVLMQINHPSIVPCASGSGMVHG